MKKLTAILTALFFCMGLFSQSNPDNLTANPTKKDGHFVGKAGTVVSGDPYMASYAIVFDFWTLFDEPVYMFRFRWDMKPGAGSNTVKINNVNKRFSAYPEVWNKMKSRLTPLTSMNDSELLTVPLYIQLRQGTKVLAHITHAARIDLPDPAGKWNVFALPSSNDWVKAFQPTKGGTTYIPFKTAGREAYDYKLQDLYKSGNKEDYKKLMIEIFKEADNIKVAPGAVSNIRWNVSDYEYAIKEKIAEQKAATTTTKTSKASELDDLLGSTGYSKEDKAKRKADEAKGSIVRADAAYSKITDYKDKAALTKAKGLYQQAASDPEAAAYAKNQIAMIDRVLNYKELNISGGDYVEIDGVKWATRNVGEPGKFVDKPEDYGGYYTWQEAGKACPLGWRLPTKDEFVKLDATVSNKTGKGREFANGQIYLPAAGFRGHTSTTLYNLDSSCHYWSSMTSLYVLYPNSSKGSVSPATGNDPIRGFPIRCIKE